MSKLKTIFTNWRVIIFILVVLMSIIAIHPILDVQGVAIRSIDRDGPAAQAGMVSPSAKIQPVDKERVLSINNMPTNTVEEFYKIESTFPVNMSVTVKTSKGLYRLMTQQNIETITTNETEKTLVTEEQFDTNLNKTVNVTKEVIAPKVVKKVLPGATLGINVFEAPATNIKKGLDLQGGTRVLLQPERELTADEMDTLISSMKERLNVYGLADINVRESSDLSGNQYIVVEVAGANEEDVKDLISKQGKFEATIENKTVFSGGKDIVHVCKTADCSGIDPQRGCAPSSEGWTCGFRFSISLSPEAAKRQADATRSLAVVSEAGDSYLSAPIVLLLDGAKVDQLRIGADLKGQAATEISISGGGSGSMREEAVNDALKSMKRLQTIMITGSLPVSITLVKTDSISSSAGRTFIQNGLFVGLMSLVAIGAVIFARYRKLVISLPIMLTLLSEGVILLGVASLINWNIDLAAIAGIVIILGTGVNHQIIITDEVLTGKKEETGDWKKSIKKAFFIIMSSYFTSFVAMIPLIFAGAGILKSFALITIIGLSIGVFITRPTYAAVIKELLK